MIEQFETNPDFAHYSNVHLTTQNIAKYFDEKSEDFVGHITHPVTGGMKVHSSPIAKMVAKS